MASGAAPARCPAPAPTAASTADRRELARFEGDSSVYRPRMFFLQANQIRYSPFIMCKSRNKPGSDQRKDAMRSERPVALWPRRVVTAGLVVGFIAEALTRLPPFLHRLLRHPLAGAALVLLCIGTLVSLVAWSRQNASGERRAFVLAVVGCGALCGISAVVAIRVGWWSGPGFDMPATTLGLVYWSGTMGYFAAVLHPYRSIASHGPSWIRAAYILTILALVGVATYLGDKLCLRHGVYVFEAGFRVWHDVLYGIAIFCSPFIVYERSRRQHKESISQNSPVVAKP